MTYARIHENRVVEIVKAIPGFSIEQCFHIDLVDKMAACNLEVQPGWYYKPETGQFSEDGSFSDLHTTQTTETTETTTQTTETTQTTQTTQTTDTTQTDTTQGA